MTEPLDLEQLCQESKTMPGALGAICYSVLKGLLIGGADPQVAAGVRVLMQEHFQNISDQDCNTLCELVATRLREEVAESGKWYGSI